MRQNNKRKKKTSFITAKPSRSRPKRCILTAIFLTPGFVNSRIHGGALKIRPSMERPIVANSGHSTYKSLKMLKFMIIY